LVEGNIGHGWYGTAGVVLGFGFFGTEMTDPENCLLKLRSHWDRRIYFSALGETSCFVGRFFRCVLEDSDISTLILGSNSRRTDACVLVNFGCFIRDKLLLLFKISIIIGRLIVVNGGPNVEQIQHKIIILNYF
jgi:hypothetical protein